MPVAQPGSLARRAAAPPRPRAGGSRVATPARPAPQRPRIAMPAVGVGAAPPAAGAAGADYSSDPILQAANQIATRNIGIAEAAAQAARSQALIAYGYAPELAGQYGDANTEGSAKANTFSTLAQIAHNHELRAQQLDRNYGGNLFFSSARGNALGEEGRQTLGEQSAAAAKLQEFLSGISDKLAGVKSSEGDRVYSAEQDAANRAVDQALRYGYGAPGAAAGGAPRTAVAAAAAARPAAARPRVARPRATPAPVYRRQP